MNNFRIGPGGSPGFSTLEGIKQAKYLSLDSMEIEFTHGVRMSDELAQEVSVVAKQNNIRLSIHAPYYINLASKEKDKVIASRKRIFDSARKADIFGKNTTVVFHAGYYMKQDPKDVYSQIRSQIEILKDSIKEQGWKVKLAPETTGKLSQFGTLNELLRLKKDTGCNICIDFAHIYARNNGNIDYEKVIQKLPNKNHCHFSGIEFGNKGEIRHLILTEEFIKPLAKAAIASKKKFNIICESPTPWEDAVLIKKVFYNQTNQ